MQLTFYTFFTAILVQTDEPKNQNKYRRVNGVWKKRVPGQWVTLRDQSIIDILNIYLIEKGV